MRKFVRVTDGNKTSGAMVTELFKKVLSEYQQARIDGNFKADVLSTVRQGIPDALRRLAGAAASGYTFSGHVGTFLAPVPWIAVFDPDITNRPQEGYYPMYLFAANGAGIYFSFNQGLAQFKQKFGSARNTIKALQYSADKMRELLGNRLDGFSFAPLDLVHSQNRVKGYQAGNVCSKFYPSDSLPSDETFRDDLLAMLKIYAAAKGILGLDTLKLVSEAEWIPDGKNMNDRLIPGEDIDIGDPSETIRIDKRMKAAITPEAIAQAIEELSEAAPPVRKTRLATTIARNPTVKKWARERDKYTCQLCDEPGFEKRDGTRYVEVHHKQELAREGMDNLPNVMCLCALCHRIIHYGSDQALLERKGHSLARSVARRDSGNDHQQRDGRGKSKSV